MATKQTTMRLGQDTLDRLDYLAKLTGQSQVGVVQELVAGATNWILEWASAHGLAEKPELLYRGGTILSVEEQQAVHQLRMIPSRGGASLWASRPNR